MLAALQSVLPAVGSKKLAQFFVIRNRTVTAFDGAQVLTAPIPCDLEFAPKAKAFVRAVKKCRETIALWQNPEGNIMIHSGDFTATVECTPLDKFPAEIQTGFWFNAPRARKPPKPKAVPPEPVWLRPDYLPRLEEARAYRPDCMTTDELVAAAMAREPLICDTEVFRNYFLVGFTSVVTGKVVFFERIFNEAVGADEIGNSVDEQPDFQGLKWILEHFPIVTFNGNFFDMAILALALAGKTCAQLKEAADRIISEQVKPWQVLKSAKVKKLSVDHIDLIEVLPLDGSLKLYAGRLHVPRMQDLPFPPDTVLSDDQLAIVRYYCLNSDLVNTAFCFWNLREQIELRQGMSTRYGMDLRSKSDAQIAEAVIVGELQRLNFTEAHRPEIPAGTRFRYRKPDFIEFQTPLLNDLLHTILSWEFEVSDTGYAEMPIDPATGKAFVPQVTIAGGTYTIGLGGLHSNETTVCHKADAETVIFDRDVTSYYPSIILNLELYPLHLGPSFLQVYRSIVQRRIEAKKAKQKAEAEMLKIVVNGSFGKFGSKWSALYAPDLLLTVTLTGQLSLLMLIEALELSGFSVISANTDGIVTKAPRWSKPHFESVFQWWEEKTGFKTEETEYAAIYSRDVNNYVAVKPDGKTKTKGAYFNPWSSKEYAYERFKKNPVCTIVIEAVTEYLTHATPIETTIRTATDVRKFVAIRTVRGGAVKDGVYLGKAVRWYYAAGEAGCIVYAKNGNKVATTDGARPCMDLSEGLPGDLDFARYEAEAAQILREIGALPPLGDTTGTPSVLECGNVED